MTEARTPWQQLLTDQHGLASTAQLLANGISPQQLRHRVQSGRWQQVLYGVHSVTNGPLVRPATLSAALLFGGPDALISHRTAAQEWGMVRVGEVEPVHITVPYGRSAVSQPATTRATGPLYRQPIVDPGWVVHPGVVVHRSRAHAHIMVATEPPRTSRPDTALDLAIAEPTARDAARTLVAVVTNARIPLVDVRTRLELRRPRRYLRPLTDALTLMADGVQSALEYRYAVDVEQAHGLPPARRQAPVVVDGRTLWEDCDYSGCGVPLIVRLDGRRYHAGAEFAFRDRRRDNAAELDNRPRLVYGWDEVSGDACGVAAEVVTVLRRGGWEGQGQGSCAACA